MTEGNRALREFIAARLRREGTRATADEILITNGAQQGIDLVSKVLLDEGDRVLVESPTYLAAVQVFAGYQARFVSAPSDDDGLVIDGLEARLVSERPSLIYLVPEFQNPKGTSLAPERREQLVALARKHRIPILEDDPYGELRFEGAFRKPLSSLDDEGWVIRLGTFSKTLAPGLRIGWVFARGELSRRLAICKQASDLHSGTLVQRALAVLLSRFDYDGHLEKLRAVYRERRDAMLAALEASMPPGTRWTRPEGGLFFWLTLPPGLRDDEVFRAAIAEEVAVVPGSGFFVGGNERRFLRLNYSNQPTERIALGIERLGRVLHALAGTERIANAAGQ